MRLHRDGYLQAGLIELWVDEVVWMRAMHVGAFLGDGFTRELSDSIGLEVEGIDTVRLIERDFDGRRVLIRVESDWMRPSRR
jgi:hypothetical protein